MWPKPPGRKGPLAERTPTTLDRDRQSALEEVARTAAARLDPQVSLALMLADAQTGAILAEVGSADFTDRARRGFVDMTRVPRSPAPRSSLHLWPRLRGGLDRTGDTDRGPAGRFLRLPAPQFRHELPRHVTIRQALQLSLNVPAVRLLDAVGPSR